MTSSNVHIHRILLAAIAAAGVAACGSGESESPAPAAEQVTEETEAVVETVEQATEEAETMAGEAAEAVTEMAEVADADGDPCTLEIEAGDSIAFNINAMSAPASCAEVTVTLTHTGTLPAAAMGHNWVVLAEEDVNAVASAGMNAGLEGNYLPPGDERVIAATKILGGGQSDSVTFSLDALEAGRSYTYVCTFPGHWTVMKGTFTVTG